MHPIVGHAVVIGDDRRYLTALISLDAEAAAHWAEEHHKDFSLEALAGDPDIRAEVEQAINAVTRTMPASKTSASGASFRGN